MARAKCLAKERAGFNTTVASPQRFEPETYGFTVKCIVHYALSASGDKAKTNVKNAPSANQL